MSNILTKVREDHIFKTQTSIRIMLACPPFARHHLQTYMRPTRYGAQLVAVAGSGNVCKGISVALHTHPVNENVIACSNYYTPKTWRLDALEKFKRLKEIKKQLGTITK